MSCLTLVFAIILVLCVFVTYFFFNDTTTPGIYTLSLHDALPICDGDFYPTADGVHPSDHGFMLIGDALAPALAGILGLAGQPVVP